MQVMSERYAAAVKTAAGITSTKTLTVSMVAFAADKAGVDLSSLLPILFEILQAAS